MMYRTSLSKAILQASSASRVHTRTFAFSATKQLGLKESSNRGSQIHTFIYIYSRLTSAETNVDYDLHKRDSLAKQKRGSGHWKPELASDSEEAVRADRAGRDSAEQMQALQERTKRAAEETSKAGTSMRDGL